MVDYTKYPNELDDNSSLPQATDNVTPVKAEVVNRIRSCVLAIEAELGTNPSGTGASIKDRLNAIEQMVSELEIIIVEGGGLTDGSVTTPRLADGAVTNVKIANNTITEDKLNFSIVGEDRQIIAGAGLTGGGTLSSDITLDVANVDGTITVGSNTISVGTIDTANIDDNAVTFDKIQDINSDRLLGRDTASSGNVEEISLNTTLEFSGSQQLQRAALTGDVTASAGSNSTTIANNIVTYAKMQDISAASRLLGRGSSGGAGDPEELTLGAGLTLSGTQLATVVSYAPTHFGKIAGAFGDGDPDFMMHQIQRASVAPTPTNITTSIARCSAFRLPFDLVVNTLRWYGVGTTTDIYHMAIYRYSDLARLTSDFTVSTSNGAWDSQAVSPGVSLTAGTLYFMAVSVDTTGTTSGIAAFGSSPTAPTAGQINVAPGSLPGNLDLDSGFFAGYCFQMGVTSGALPDPGGTLAGAGSWAGFVPAIFLDNA